MEGQPAPEEEVIIETPEAEAAPESIETAPVETGEETAVEGVETPTYEPNYMFKVHGQEKEFDEWAKSLVKDQDSEKQFREVMEKIHGIDHIKEDREQLRTQNETLQTTAQRFNNLEGELGTLDKFIQNKNYDAFFKKTNINEDDILHWAAKRLQYYEMDPQQRAEYDRSVEAQTNEVYYGQQNQTLEQQMQALKYEQTQFRLEQHLAQPGVTDQVQQYDQRLGQGAFRKAVEERGLYHYYQSGQDVPVEQAVQEVMLIAGMQPNTAQSPAPQAVPQAHMSNPPSTPPQVQKKPVIPRVGGSGTSPIKAGVRSIDDLKKLAASRS
jgi:hypothetical protein